MSTITTQLPQLPLQWWRLRLEANEDGHLMRVNLLKDGQPLTVDTPTAADRCVHEIFDGCEGELRNVVSSAFRTDVCRHTYLYVLAYGKPSDAPWVPLEHVALWPRELQGGL